MTAMGGPLPFPGDAGRSRAVELSWQGRQRLQRLHSDMVCLEVAGPAVRTLRSFRANSP
jgi:hypothetical protein